MCTVNEDKIHMSPTQGKILSSCLSGISEEEDEAQFIYCEILHYISTHCVEVLRMHESSLSEWSR